MRKIPKLIYGTYFWKTVDIQLAKNQIVKDKKVIKSHKEAMKYMNELGNQLLDRNKPLFEFRLVENYTEQASLIFFRCSHTFTDGCGVSSLFSTLNDDQFTAVHNKKPFEPTLSERIKLWITSPFGYKKFIDLVSSQPVDEKARELFESSQI